MKTTITALAATWVIAACGGGGTTLPPPAPVPTMQEGLYLGTSMSIDSWGYAGLPTSFIVLEQQEVWVLDGRNPPRNFGQGTFAYAGKGTLSNGSPANVFVQAKAIAAINSNVLGERPMELRFGELASLPFVFMPQPGLIEPLSARLTPSTSFDYNRAASIADVTGQWGEVTANNNSYVGVAPLTIRNFGELSTPPQNSGCSVTGTLKPRLSGKNIFNLAVTLAGCADAGEYAGIAFSYIDTSNYSRGSVEGPIYYGVPTFRLIAINTTKTRLFNLTTTR